MVLNEISRMNWIEMQFVFVVKNLTGKSGRKHAYLQYIFMNFYDKRCKLLILCAVCVCTFFVVVISTFCLQIWHVWIAREKRNKKISINPFYGLARILRCVYCPVLFGILTNHIFVSKLTQMTSNQCKIQLVVKLRLFCRIICNNSNTGQHFRSNIKLCLFCNGFVFLFKHS